MNHIALPAFLAALVLGACSSDNAATPGGGAGTPAADHVAIAATLTCQDGTAPIHPVTLAAARLDRCIYRPSIQRLDVQIDDGVGGNMFVAQISKFTGVGTFVTGNTTSETDTFVEMRGQQTTVDTSKASAPPPGDCAAHACSFTVTQAGVVTAGAGGQGTVAFDLECPVLGAAGTECTVCAVSPTTFHVDVAACARDD